MSYCIEQKCYCSLSYLRSVVMFCVAVENVIFKDPGCGTVGGAIASPRAESMLFLSGAWLDAFNLNKPFPLRPFVALKGLSLPTGVHTCSECWAPSSWSVHRSHFFLLLQKLIELNRGKVIVNKAFTVTDVASVTVMGGGDKKYEKWCRKNAVTFLWLFV